VSKIYFVVTGWGDPGLVEAELLKETACFYYIDPVKIQAHVGSSGAVAARVPKGKRKYKPFTNLHQARGHVIALMRTDALGHADKAQATLERASALTAAWGMEIL
jgi:hypothetical protein